jgi:dihydroorotate dehydrogenase (NAD+) catalytic subunit
VKEGGIEFGRDPKMCARVTEAVKAKTSIPVWVKMSPEAGDIVAVARAVEDDGADAVTAINTIRGLSIDPESQRPRLAHSTGGLSGPALRPIALRIVWELKQQIDIPIIGIGGVSTTRDAIEFLLAGATAVQVGTASFADPCAAQKIQQGIVEYCEEHQICVDELVGRATR